ncbi:hypothetical protein BDZ97DRAFT_1856387, partial [Flammula alnicola]
MNSLSGHIHRLKGSLGRALVPKKSRTAKIGHSHPSTLSQTEDQLDDNDFGLVKINLSSERVSSMPASSERRSTIPQADDQRDEAVYNSTINWPEMLPFVAEQPPHPSPSRPVISPSIDDIPLPAHLFTDEIDLGQQMELTSWTGLPPPCRGPRAVDLLPWTPENASPTESSTSSGATDHSHDESQPAAACDPPPADGPVPPSDSKFL